MKESTNKGESLGKIVREILFSEGGFSLLVIFPLTALYYLKMAMDTF